MSSIATAMRPGVEAAPLSATLLCSAARPDRTAEPPRIAWIITSASNTTQRYLYGETVTAKDLLAAFGVSGSVSDRASTLLRAIGASTRTPASARSSSRLPTC